MKNKNVLLKKEIQKKPVSEIKELQNVLNQKLKQRLFKSAGTLSAKAKNIFDKIEPGKDLDYKKNKGRTLSEFFEKTVKPKLKAKKISKKEISEIEQNIKEKESDTVDQILLLDEPLADNPLFKDELRNAKFDTFNRMLGLEKKLWSLRQEQLDWDEITETHLESIDGLTDKEKNRVLLSSNLSRLTGANIELVESISSKPEVSSLPDLISWDRSDWEEHLKTINELEVPDEEDSVSTYTERMRSLVEETYPTPYFLSRTISDKIDDTTSKRISKVAKWQKKTTDNKPLIRSGRINHSAVKELGIKENSEDFDDLQELIKVVNRYRHLGIEHILNDTELNITDKKKTLNDRLSLLQKFYSLNPHLNLETARFNRERNPYNWGDMKPDDQKLVRRQMKAYQRVQALSGNTATGKVLLETGFDSAIAISKLTESEFIAKTGFDFADGKRVHRNATDLINKSGHYFEAIRDSLFGTFNELAVNNQGALVNDLKDIDGFDDIFGSQDFCECKHCRSIFSPAAYFTDLMYFIYKNISDKIFLPSKNDHPLYLRNRRPDLWALELSCKNTNELIPYLEIVNEVLEAYIEQEESRDSAYKLLNSADNAIVMPFNLPLEELRTYLKYFDIGLHEIYDLLQMDRQDILREVFSISSEELQIIVRPDNDAHKYFGQNSHFNTIDVKSFLKIASISRDELDVLLRSDFISQLNSINTEIKEQKNDEGDVIGMYEEMTGITENRLDLLHRYLRLCKKTPWTFKETDYLLNFLKEKGMISNLEGSVSGTSKLLRLAKLHLIQEELDLSLDQLISLFCDIPDKPFKEGGVPFYDNIFDLERLFEGDDKFTLLADRNADTKTPLLCSSLGISEPDFNQLINRSVDQEIRHADLSDLYRNVLFARKVGWSIEELTIAKQLLLSNDAIDSILAIDELLDFEKWIRESPFSIGDILFISKGEESSSIRFEFSSDYVESVIIDIQSKPHIDDFIKELFNYNDEVFDLIKNNFLDSFDYSTELQALKDDADLENNLAAHAVAINKLTDHLSLYERIKLLFETLEFNFGDYEFLQRNADVFNIGNLKIQSVTFDDIDSLLSYSESFENEEEQDIIQKVLADYQSDSTLTDASISELATLWERPVSQLASLASDIPALGAAIPFLVTLKERGDLSDKLGIEGISLNKFTQLGYGALKEVRDIVISSISSQYSDEENREEILETYTDKINTIKRDALCAFIIGTRKFKFKDRADLYKFFLLDVEMSGCFRTSRIVCANSSLQLYVHRCLMNLEQSDPLLNPDVEDINIDPKLIPAKQWEWKKNYRVWEANRKVFLYPENYIEPALRDNKTHLFEELEDELLQENITSESAEMAYKKYLKSFNKLTRLRYAGAYYDSIPGGKLFYSLTNGNKISSKSGYVNLDYSISSKSDFGQLGNLFGSHESKDSKYYLFARTNTDPYEYYYRTYNHSKKVWKNWIKIDLGIEAEEVSVAKHLGRLYIFWTEVVSKEVSSFEGGSSESKGFVFNTSVKYSFLKEDGEWSNPQVLDMGHLRADRKKIFKRILNDNPDSDEKDKLKESVLKKFEEEVFRKPYTILRNNNAFPFRTYHVWSHHFEEMEDIRYSTDSHNLNFNYNIDINVPILNKKTVGNYQISVEIPSTSFIVTNGDFSSLPSLLVGAKVELETPLNFISGEKYIFEHLELSHDGDNQFSIRFDIDFEWNFGPIKIPFEFSIVYTIDATAKEISSPLKASYHNLSLSKNKYLNKKDVQFNLNIHSNYGNIKASFFDFLSDEAALNILDDETISFYVEDGSKNFTSLGRKLTQFQNTDAHLTIPNDLGLIPQVPLTTILQDEFTNVLYNEGLEEFLSLQTQMMNDSVGAQIDMKGPYGEYYWELFFHIPFLIANHLNANQKFEEAKWWYERIFNPTTEQNSTDQDSTEYMWQFRLFRNLGIESLEDILNDENALEAYREDPFDPHAIARLRPNAYQKAIVIKYIDNLLDWGDYLFAQDTRESITEANMVYQLAYDILGERPTELGECESAAEKDLTYDILEEELDEEEEFLVTLENVYLEIRAADQFDKKPVSITKHLKGTLQRIDKQEYTSKIANLQDLANRRRLSDYEINITTVTDGEGRVTDVPFESQMDRTYQPVSRVQKYESRMRTFIETKDRYRHAQWKDAEQALEVEERRVDFEKSLTPVTDFVPQATLRYKESLAFCIPHNENLLDYWDRVEDRLYKIRHCMNISGTVRSLALFQPPIDPMMLVRATAAGLNLNDIMAMADKVPLYRFNYLVNKAKEFTQTVISLGNSLLSALEKKDTEELRLLSSVHKQNILNMTEEVKKKQIEEAKYNLEATKEAKENVLNRIDYYEGLISTGLLQWEVAEQVSQHTATAFVTAESILRLTAGINYLIPQLGAPTALKWGGKEMGDSLSSFAELSGAMAHIANSVSASAGLEARNQRREEGWEHQLNLAQQELKQMEKQELSGEIRIALAEKDLEIHKMNVDQTEEIHDFHKDKFTGLALYDFLASNLNRLYRQAYNLAVDIARQAEKAYQFELNQNDYFIESDNWETNKAGLLSGQRLLFQLQSLEKNYMEKNERVPEISQTFSLSLLNPAKLIELRQKGSCTFAIPEIAFELVYPGMYRRTIRGVQVSIPCVVGPYTNIGAKLTLVNSKIKAEADAVLENHNIAKGDYMYTSGAQNDSGMFEFNFRDERRLLFEGAGAVSEWQIELPASIRSFNYDSISDIMITLSYSAVDGDRATAEQNLVSTLTNYAQAEGLFRVISLKNEFGSNFHKLLNPGEGNPQKTTINLQTNHFPHYLRGHSLEISDFDVYLKPKSQAEIGRPNQIKINDTGVEWDHNQDIEHTGTEDAAVGKLKYGSINISESPIGSWEVDASDDGLDKNTVDDIIFVLKYRIDNS